jgi:hypothetical protein
VGSETRRELVRGRNYPDPHRRATARAWESATVTPSIDRAALRRAPRAGIRPCRRDDPRNETLFSHGRGPVRLAE